MAAYAAYFKNKKDKNAYEQPFIDDSYSLFFSQKLLQPLPSLQVIIPTLKTGYVYFLKGCFCMILRKTDLQKF